MRKQIGLVALGAVLTILPVPAGAGLDLSDPHAVAQQWLRSGCALGEEPLTGAVRRLGPALTDEFVRAVDSGPSPEELAEVDRASRAAYARRQQALKDGAGLGLSEEDLARARTTSEDEFVARERRNFDLRYRSQGVAGLGLIGDAASRALLQRLARDERSPLRSSAQQALRQARPAKGR